MHRKFFCARKQTHYDVDWERIEFEKISIFLEIHASPISKWLRVPPSLPGPQTWKLLALLGYVMTANQHLTAHITRSFTNKPYAGLVAIVSATRQRLSPTSFHARPSVRPD
jgi:hypothetical protein